MRLIPLLFALMIAAPAFAVEDLPRIKIDYYVYAWSGTSEDQMTSRLTVVNYLSGVRDHLWWECEYEVTIQQLIEGANMQIKAARMTMDDARFDKFLEDTPFGDMVFLSLHNEALYGKAEPCSK
ncbi:hypothetical protein [Sinorhizobium meliloti]|uniref:hypothetical protein n=1 Tax=Rhizobium meliloti TaxID=382 RepID=UPI00299E8C8C